MFTKEPRISVIIPCYNQAHFLGESIESVLSQTCPAGEILVIDDGSTDHTAEVAAAYPSVRCIHQANQGPSAARNLGAAECSGEYLVFLDADDRLLPVALNSGAEILDRSPGCAFVSSRYHWIDRHGAVLPGWREIRQGDEEGVASLGWEFVDAGGAVRKRWPAAARSHWGHYAALLRRNYIEMLSAVMFRRDIFLEIGGFDVSLRAAEDYDLFLRTARRYPVTCGSEVVAEYRRHEVSATRDKGAMLAGALQVLDRQRSAVQGNRMYEAAFQAGVVAFFEHYGFRSLPGLFLRSRTAGLVARYIPIYLRRKFLPSNPDHLS